MSSVNQIIRTKKFEKKVQSVKNNSTKERIKKQIIKIIKNPSLGKPLRFGLKGERTVYVKSYRIVYSFKNKTIYFLRFEHRDEVYKRK